MLENGNTFQTRGIIQILPTWRGMPFHLLTIARDRATIRSLFGREWNVERNEVAEVEYRRARLILIMQTQIIFRRSDGRRVPPFVSGRPRRVLAALEEMEWPVRETGYVRETIRTLRGDRA